jgi:hypothetical protein
LVSFFPHLAAAAFDAISFVRFKPIFLARALPPIEASSLTVKAWAGGLFFISKNYACSHVPASSCAGTQGILLWLFEGKNQSMIGSPAVFDRMTPSACEAEFLEFFRRPYSTILTVPPTPNVSWRFRRS